MRKFVFIILMPTLVLAACTGDQPSPKPSSQSLLPTVATQPSIRALAIDAVSSINCPQTDQRGDPRPLDEDGDGVARCDIGLSEEPVP